MLNHYQVKGRLGIEQQEVDRLLVDMETMRDGLGDAEGSQVMGGVTALELCGSLDSRLATVVQLHHVHIHGLGHHRAARNGSPGPIMLWILVVAFVENIGPDAVELWNARTVDFVDDAVHQEDKVENTLTTKVEEMEAGNGEEIKYCGSHSMEQPFTISI